MNIEQLNEALKASGCEFDHWATDLYVPKTPETAAIVKQYQYYKQNVTTFRSQIDGTTWYDIPFAYIPE